VNAPLRIDVIDRNSDHFIFRTEEPARLEVSLVETAPHEWSILAHAYSGVEDDVLDEPEAVYDGTVNPDVPLYERCAECHLFVEPNDSYEPGLGIAEYLHLHRGNREDELLDETHEAKPSGERRDLAYWKQHGPHAMRARFIR
jgi:hypothetical protein